MSETQMLTIAPATVPTFLVVLVGILINNSRLTDLRSHMDSRFAGMDARFADVARVQDAHFKLLLGKVEDIDTRLTRLEERFAR